LASPPGAAVRLSSVIWVIFSAVVWLCVDGVLAAVAAPRIADAVTTPPYAYGNAPGPGPAGLTMTRNRGPRQRNGSHPRSIRGMARKNERTRQPVAMARMVPQKDSNLRTWLRRGVRQIASASAKVL
jgi:hypothetical protein